MRQPKHSPKSRRTFWRRLRQAARWLLPILQVIGVIVGIVAAIGRMLGWW